MADVCRVIGGCLEGAWSESERCVEGVWKGFGG